MAIQPGTRLGPYEILSAIGAGGMGEVYRARDTRLGREVALKILPQSFDHDSDRLRRFRQEAQAVAALNHPNIMAIFDIGERDGAPFLVSELLEGESLRAALERGPLPQRKAIEYAVQIANGLAAAHDKGIVHRDLKPDNIFICRDGRVKILDFGVAKLAAASSGKPDGATMTASPTAAGVVVGTASYMAPEQVRSEPVDARADMFALGTVLFEMVTGKRAFQRDTTAETMTAVLKQDPPDISEIKPPISPALERIIRRCLEKNPEQRFQSAKDLAFALESLSQTSTANSVAAKAAIAGANARSRGKWIAIAGATALAAAALVVAGWWFGGAGSAAAPLEYQQVTFRSGYVENARFAPDGSVIYSAVWDGGDRRVYISRLGENGATDLGLKDAEVLSVSKNGELAVRLNTAFGSGYEQWGTLARVPQSGGAPREISDDVQDADWGPDGESMAIVRLVPQTLHWRLEYPIGKVLLDSIDWISKPRVSPDGKLVAFEDHGNSIGDDEGSVAVIDREGHERKLSSGWISLEGVEWSSSGNEIWFSASDSGAADNLRAVTLGGKLRSITNVPGGMWLEDVRNHLALMTTHHERVNVRGMGPGGKQEHELGWLGWSILQDISRDGTKVLFEEEAEGGGPNYTVFLRDTDGSPPVQIGQGAACAISPDNKWVITRPTKFGALSVVPTGPGESRVLTHDHITYGDVRYMPDGKQLLAEGIEPGHGARNYLVDLSNGNAKPVTPEGVVGDVLSPDGNEVVVAAPDGTPEIWSFAAGAAKPIRGIDSKHEVLGWTPDQSSLYVALSGRGESTVRVSKLNLATGKMEFWKEFGTNLPTASSGVDPPTIALGGGYAYMYSQIDSEAYVVKGLK
ncbi:MAG: WD40 repeat domain-containing serine/threonine protein kinase [Candidatus Acidiferrales bacterium]